MRKTVTAVAVLTFSVTLALAGPGRDERGFAGKGGAEFSAKFAEKLNLTEAQKTQIQSLRESFRAQTEPQRAELRRLTTEFRAAREANDTARAQSLRSQIQALHTQLRESAQAQKARFEAVLTPEQRAQLETLKSQRRGKMRGHHAKRGGDFGAKFAEKLNLSDTQKTQMNTLRQNFRAASEPYRERTRQLATELRQAREANDTARVEALRAQIEGQRAQMKVLADSHRQQVLSILTPEQRTQLESFKGKGKGRR